MDERMKVYNKVEIDCYDNEPEWPPEPLADFVAWAQRQLDAIPAEHRHTARIALTTTSDYSSEGDHACIRITWTRPETDDEMAARVAAAQRNAEARKQWVEAQERATLAALQAKYAARL